MATSLAAQQQQFHRYPGTPTEELRKLAASGDADAIFQLGERRDKDSLPLLQKFAVPINVEAGTAKPQSLAELRKSHDFRKRSALSLEARRALARIGVHPNISDYLACASNKKAALRMLCIRNLGYIGDATAVKTLGPILSEDGFPPHGFDELVSSYAELASQALGEILPDTQAVWMMGSPDSRSHLEQWKRWWKDHQDFDPDHYRETKEPEKKGGFRKLFR